MKCEQFIFFNGGSFAGGVAEPHPSGFAGEVFHPSPSGNKPKVDGYTHSVCGNPGGSHTPFSRSSQQHTKRGPIEAGPNNMGVDRVGTGWDDGPVLWWTQRWFWQNSWGVGVWAGVGMQKTSPKNTQEYQKSD